MAGFAWHALREAVYGPQSDRLLLVRYETLTTSPLSTTTSTSPCSPTPPKTSSPPVVLGVGVPCAPTAVMSYGPVTGAMKVSMVWVTPKVQVGPAWAAEAAMSAKRGVPNIRNNFIIKTLSSFMHENVMTLSKSHVND